MMKGAAMNDSKSFTRRKFKRKQIKKNRNHLQKQFVIINIYEQKDEISLTVTELHTGKTHSTPAL